jgi:hypothetical protein
MQESPIRALLSGSNVHDVMPCYINHQLYDSASKPTGTYISSSSYNHDCPWER